MSLKESCVIVFVKYPDPGEVKQRLARQIGSTAAAQLYQSMVKDQLHTLQQTQLPLYLLFTPSHEEENVSQWLGSQYSYIPQQGENLGQRMHHAFTSLFQHGYARVILLGSDIPDVPFEYLTQADHSLALHDVVIGPAVDGGYYLIGFNKHSYHSSVFDDISWGLDTVLSQTRDRIDKLHLSSHQVPVWYDIDTIEDVYEYIKRNTHQKRTSLHTMSFLREHQLELSFPAEIQKLLTDQPVSSSLPTGDST